MNIRAKKALSSGPVKPDRAPLIRVGRRGTVVIPAGLRRASGLEEGSLFTAELRADGVLLRPVSIRPRITEEERNRFWDAVKRADQTLRDDPAAWGAELEERRLLEGTLLDGLDPSEVWSDDDFEAPPEAPH